MSSIEDCGFEDGVEQAFEESISYSLEDCRIRRNVTIVSVLSTNRIIVKESGNDKLEEKYKSLQKQLADAWKTKHKFREENEPYAGMHVMVRSREWEGICRAVIREKLPYHDNPQYSVFMYDIGKIDLLTEVNIAPLPSELRLQLTSRSYSLLILGVVPSRLHTDLNVMLSGQGSNGAKREYVEAGEWSGASLQYVKQWVGNGDFAVIIHKSIDNAVKIGDVCRRKHSDSSNSQYESLSESLVQSNNALFSNSMADKQLSHELFEPIPMEELTESYHVRSNNSGKDFAAKGDSTSHGIKSVDDPINLEEINQKSYLVKNFKQGKEMSNTDNVPGSSNSDSGRNIGLTNESKIKTQVTEEKPKAKRYTRFAPVKDIGSLTTTSVANNESVINKLRVGCCEIPAARSSVKIADVPGRTLVRGIDVQPPLTSFNKFALFAPIQKGWANLGLEEGNELQKGVWPNFAKGHDLFIIGGSRNGKTLAYLAPICSELLVNAGATRKDNCTGALAVIVCSSTASGLKIEKHGETLLTSQNMNQMLCRFVKDHRVEKGEIDVLVTTVDTLLFNHKKYEPSFNFDRLRFLIFDDAHKLLKEQKKEVMKIIDEYKDYICKQKANPQLIVCGNEWTANIEELYWTFSQRPTIHLGSAKQAMVYSAIKLKLHHTPEDTGLPILADLLKKETNHHKRIVVVCGSEKSANFVQLELQNRYGVYAHLAIDIAPDTLKSISMLWTDASDDMQQVLVCTDQVLKYTNITDATSLIHYELKDSNATSNKSATLFSRMSCMWSHFRDITAESVMVPWKERGSFGKKLSSDIFISGEEEDLDRIITALMKIGEEIPSAIEAYAAKAHESRMEKANMCMGMKLFGWCDYTALNTCSQRHNFLKKDIEMTPTLPRAGQVELRVIECKNPSLYICEIIRYYDMKNKNQSFSYAGKLQKYAELMNQHYQLKENRIQLKSFKPGSLCAILLNDEGYCRAEITKVMTQTSYGCPDGIKIYCIDTGLTKTERTGNIYSLPSNIADLPRLCVEVIVNSMKPLKNEKEYNNLQSEFARGLTENKIYLGKIFCSIKNTVWVNPLVASKCDKNGKVVTDHSVRLYILQAKKAEVNTKHEKAIVDLCRQAEYPMIEFGSSYGLINNIKSNSSFFQEQDEYSWAYLPLSKLTTPEEILLSIVYIQNPWLVYGNLAKFVDLLDTLNKDINEEVESTKETIVKEYSDQFDAYFEIGLVVLAFLPSDEKWYRAIITDKGTEDDGLTYYTVFFVDFGDTVDDAKSDTLLPIPKKYVERLPFQIIALNASHVSPKEENHDYSAYEPWSKESVDFLFDTMIPGGEAQDVKVVAYEKDVESESETVLCKYYCGFAFLNNGDDFGETLVKQGFAEFNRLGENNIKKVKEGLLAYYNSRFDEKNTLDVDDDDDDSYYKNDQPIEDANDTSPKAYPDGFFDDEEFDVYIPEVEEPLRQLGITDAGLKHIRNAVCEKLGSTLKPDTPPTENVECDNKEEKDQKEVASPQPASKTVGDGLRHPKTLWSQTENEICLKIDMPDISEYTLTLDKRNISFRTIKPPNYGFDLESFGALKNQREFLTGQYFRVKFEKRMTGVVWPAFSRDRDLKLPWFKEELQFGDDLEEENESKCELIPVDYEKMFPESESDSDDYTDEEDLDDFDEEAYKLTNTDRYGMSLSHKTTPM